MQVTCAPHNLWSLPNDPSVQFIRRDAYSLTEVVDYISGKTAPACLFVHDGKTDGLADFADCPPIEESLRQMSRGDKLLVQRKRPGSLEHLPTGVLLDEEELRESRMRFIFYVKV